MTQSQPTAALNHLRVLDLTNGLGQMCPRALGDLGSDVIKVEPPEGDPTRRMAPFAGDEPGPERSLRFIHANRSKRSVVIDLDTPEGWEPVPLPGGALRHTGGGPDARIPGQPRPGLR